MATLLKGRPVVDQMACSLAERIENLTSAGITPRLALVRVGERPDDLSYERTAIKRAESLGVVTVSRVLDENASQEDLMNVLNEINQDKSIHGCLMFRPLPVAIDEKAMCDMLAVEKDIDGVSIASLASVFTDADDGFPPCTAAACIHMLDHYGISVAGKHVAVVGRSLVVGKPVSMMLLRRNASVTICHSKTEHLQEICRSADIVICATGRARAFGAEFFKPGQTVLDVGINFDEDGCLCGDVDFQAVEPIVAAITPVPGGIGTVTTSTTMVHTVAAAERSLSK